MDRLRLAIARRVARQAQRVREADRELLRRRGSFVIEAQWERAEELRTDRLGPSEDDVQNTDPERPGTSLH
jgi:ribosome biogenesis protein Tsr3